MRDAGSKDHFPQVAAARAGARPECPPVLPDGIARVRGDESASCALHWPMLIHVRRKP